MLTTLLAAGLLAATTAHAGALADGFRGIPYGDIAVLNKPPMPDCIHPEARTGVRWACPTSIGDVPVGVHYMGGHGIYYGVLVKAQGYTAHLGLRAALRGAWGEPIDGPPGVLIWMDGPVMGSLQYTRAGQVVTLVMVHQPLQEQYKQLAAEAARAAGKGDL